MAESRSKAQAMIAEGFVLLNGKTVKKPSVSVEEGDTVTVEAPRGAIKYTVTKIER